MVTRLFSARIVLVFLAAAMTGAAASVSADVLVLPSQDQRAHSLLGRTGALRKLDTALARLRAEHLDHAGSAAAASFRPSDPFLQFYHGRVLIQARANGNAVALSSELQHKGLEDGQLYGPLVSGWLPVGQIESAAALSGLQSISAVRSPVLNTGSVISQGDAALQADDARMPIPDGYGVDGSGVTVGIISDSFDKSGTATTTAATDRTTGDLPAGDPVLPDGEYGLCGLLVTCTDEGRAMLQIVHDLAPGASLLFHTGLGGTVAYANAIEELAVAGADVIVDDLSYLYEPMFQDGIVAQAVDSVVSAGKVYFSAAGNSARDSYEAPFSGSGEDLCIDIDENGYCDPLFELVGEMHDFDPGPSVDTYQSVTIPQYATINLALQWNEPFGNPNTGDGPDNDQDILLLATNDDGDWVVVGISANDNIATGEPWEVLQFTNDGTYGTELNIVITHDYVDSSPASGATLLKAVDFSSSGVTFNEYMTDSSTIVGHTNAAGAIATGAAYFGDTPEWGVSPPLLESYSSAGGTPILFDTNGDPQAAEVRNKPEVVAVDGVNTTFFFADSDPPGGDGIPDFFGTSAAAPHAAAIGALMLDTAPGAFASDILAALQATAIDMDAPGFDYESGFGLIQADAAIGELLAGTCPASLVLSSLTVGGIESREASDIITASTVTVTGTGQLTLTSNEVDLENGFSVEVGGRLAIANGSCI